MRLISAFLILFCAIYCCGQGPNIVLILADDMGWGDLSMNGNKNISTPNIDKLALEGISFEKFYVAPVCSPSRAEILTGRYHVRSGVFSTTAGGERIDSDELLIAEVLKEAGYSTAVYGKWHNGMQAPYHPNSRGFDDFYGFASGHWGNYFSPMLEHNGEIVKGKGFLANDLTDHALSFMKENRRKPFFVYLPLNTPHSPMQVPDEYWDEMKEKPLQMFNRKAEQEDTMFTKAALAMVENIDDNVGRIVEEVDRLKLSKKTIVVFLSDNGPNGVRWNGGMKGRKGSTDEGGVRSPLIVKWKSKLPEGEKKVGITSAVDLFPTLLGLAKIAYEVPNKLDGVDVFKQTEDRIIYNYWKGKLSLRSQEFRLGQNDGLFHMDTDPGQLKDVRFEYPAVYQELITKKKSWLNEVASELDLAVQRPITIGHPSMSLHQIPARDAQISGDLKRSNRWPNCSFFTDWTSVNDEIYWNVEVIESGEYEVDIYYTCAKTNLGSEVRLSSGNTDLHFVINEAHDPPLIGKGDDIYPRMESYVKDFKALKLGRMKLEEGLQKLSLKAIKVPGKEVMDFRLLMFKKI